MIHRIQYKGGQQGLVLVRISEIDTLEKRVERCKKYLEDAIDGDSPCDHEITMALHILHGEI